MIEVSPLFTIFRLPPNDILGSEYHNLRTDMPRLMEFRMWLNSRFCIPWLNSKYKVVARAYSLTRTSTRTNNIHIHIRIHVGPSGLTLGSPFLAPEVIPPIRANFSAYSLRTPKLETETISQLHTCDVTCVHRCCACNCQLISDTLMLVNRILYSQ